MGLFLLLLVLNGEDLEGNADGQKQEGGRERWVHLACTFSLLFSPFVFVLGWLAGMAGRLLSWLSCVGLAGWLGWASCESELARPET